MKAIFLTMLIAGCALAKIPSVSEMSIRPGEVRWIEQELANKDVRLICGDQIVKTQRVGTKIQAVVVANYFSEILPFTCTFKENDKILHDIHFKVESREYPAETLKVNFKTIKLSPKDQKRSDEEQVILNKIYASSLNQLLFTKPFMQPMSSEVTSHYGTKRIYNNHKKSQHLGIDFRAPIGQNVPATNAGKVVFAGDLFYTGWTVIIDHGLDIFTVYGHLSKTLVRADEMVERGQIIGLSGNTGRSSGPHLHWGVKVQGQYVDGSILVDETKKKFKE